MSKQGMYIFYRTGVFLTNLYHSFFLFFAFIGHLCLSSSKIITRQLRISGITIVKILYHSGAALTLPLMIISVLIGISFAINIYKILSPFHLESKALSIAQHLLTVDILPLLLGLVLCVQSSLNLITARIKINQHGYTPDQVILQYIVPIYIGTFLTGMLLYCYMFFAMISSLYVTFHFFLSNTSHEFWLSMARSTTNIGIFLSLIKTLFYCLVVSTVAGYYYYQIAINHVNLRRAVSRILTRGTFWLAVTSVGIKFINF